MPVQHLYCLCSTFLRGQRASTARCKASHQPGRYLFGPLLSEIPATKTSFTFVARRKCRTLLSHLLHHAAAEVALGLALLDRVALVVLLLAPRQPDLKLRQAVLKVQRERHERQSLLLGLP